ncbi:hypothetical protein HPK16_05100 [Listeria sp. W9-0585]|uniref:DUF6985 domain-containing protein n=1 Tax=Listeria rustica TaxID=2713503 RepID=A0A7W1T5H5_9LIST|nr:hypothetical protein [Listeria rustica]MBA3925716.1 hypothetical protein [Listeria rustica]
MSLKIKHDILGDLTYDYGWVKNIALELFGVRKTIQVIIDADENADFEKAQVQAFEAFFNKFEKIVRRAEVAVFNFYQKESP